MVIDWANKKIQIRTPQLQHLLKEIHRLLSFLETISLKHIYRELNTEADLLSKLVLAVPPGNIETKDFRGGQSVRHFSEQI